MIITRLGLKPGHKVCESGTGTGSLSVSLCKTIFPKGHLFTFEFNEVRVKKAKIDFERLGLDSFITVTHRDVLSDGFVLGEDVTPSSMDACFLDLPSPERAIPHAY